MHILTALLIILGLAIFEIVSSIDNAVINAEILDTMSPKGRKWFLSWGFLIAVFAVRGVLPWAIIWGANPSLGPLGALTATFSSNPDIAASIMRSAPILLAGGGIFLVFLFLHWLFLEPKKLGLRHERFLEKFGMLFYGFAAAVLIVVAAYGMRNVPGMAFGAFAGAAVFFVMQGFKKNAERAEEKMRKEGSKEKKEGGKNGRGARSDMSKILYLEIIDASFSVDGVLGAFAFTFSVPFILIGSAIGAFVLRSLTVRNIERIKKYVFLKTGAMYAIGALSVIMILGAFGHQIPEWVSPVVMIAIVGYFFLKSKKNLVS